LSVVNKKGIILFDVTVANFQVQTIRCRWHEL